MVFQIFAYFAFQVLMGGGTRVEQPREIQRRFQLDVLGVVACSVAGYILFLRFIRKEGAEQLRLQAEISLARQVHDVLVPPVALSRPSTPVASPSGSSGSRSACRAMPSDRWSRSSRPCSRPSRAMGSAPTIRRCSSCEGADRALLRRRPSVLLCRGCRKSFSSRASIAPSKEDRLALASIALGIAAGLGAGVVHVVSGPDHLAALSPLALARGRSAWKLGVRWGIGHSLGATAIVGLALAARERLDLRAFSGWGERAVGASLIVIGLWSLRRALTGHVHVHRHAHGDGVEHVHAHVHSLARAHDPSGPRASSAPGHAHSHAATGIGLLHGLTGGSHLIVTLPALALPLPAAVSYLGGFAAGTVLAMAIFTQALSGAARRLPARAALAHRWLMGAAACVALASGVWWMAGGAW